MDSMDLSFVKKALESLEEILKQPMDVYRRDGYIESIEPWFSFLEKRNLTIHTYNEQVADEVFEAAKAFPSFVRKMLEKLQNESSD